MFNLQKNTVAVALLVLVLELKTLLGLPLEVPPNPAVPSQLSPNLSPASDVSSDVAVRSANFSESSPVVRSALDNVQSVNLSNNSPSFRSGFENVQSANVSADVAVPAARLQPELTNPPVNIAPRSSFELNAQAPGANPSSIDKRSEFNSQQEASIASVAAPALRSGLVELSNSSSSSTVQERSLNVTGSNADVAVRAANNSQIEVRSGLNLDLPASSNSSNNNAPASRSLPSENGNASVSVNVRSNFEPPSLVNNNNPVPIAPQSSTNAEGSSSNVNVRSNFQLSETAGSPSNVAPLPQANVNAEPVAGAVFLRSQPEAPASLEPAGSSAVIIPYINVYPLETVE